MTSLKTASLLLVVIAALLVVSGSGAFSLAEVDRSAEVSAVGDDEAYLALDFEDDDEAINLSEDEETLLFTVTNQFSDDLETLEVTATGDSDFKDEDVYVEPTDLGPRDTTGVTTDYECDGGDDDPTAEFEIFGDTGSESVEAVRSVDVTCNG